MIAASTVKILDINGIIIPGGASIYERW
jgi:hypothetical protein